MEGKRHNRDSITQPIQAARRPTSPARPGPPRQRTPPPHPRAPSPRAPGRLTLLVAQNCRCPSLISGVNFCSRAFWTRQMGGGSRPVCSAS